LKKALVRGDFWGIGSIGATLAVSRELKPAFPPKEIDHSRIHRDSNTRVDRPMLPVTFVSLPSSASMVMARRRDIQRAVENFNEAIRLGRAYDEGPTDCGRLRKWQRENRRMRIATSGGCDRHVVPDARAHSCC
jgi:hypothetical protein